MSKSTEPVRSMRSTGLCTTRMFCTRSSEAEFSFRDRMPVRIIRCFVVIRYRVKTRRSQPARSTRTKPPASTAMPIQSGQSVPDTLAITITASGRSASAVHLM